MATEYELSILQSHSPAQLRANELTRSAKKAHLIDLNYRDPQKVEEVLTQLYGPDPNPPKPTEDRIPAEDMEGIDKNIDKLIDGYYTKRGPYKPTSVTAAIGKGYSRGTTPQAQQSQPIGFLTAGVPKQAPKQTVEMKKDERSEAIARGYTGEMCQNPECGMFTVRRNGSCFLCDSCGRTTGCS